MSEVKFQPFQKVLVRMVGNIWKADCFSHYECKKEKPLVTTSGYRFNSEEVLPYDDETKHLIGTNNNFKPDFIWGDHVEVSSDKDYWYKAIYINKTNDGRFSAVISEDTVVDSWCYCRHADW